MKFDNKDKLEKLKKEVQAQMEAKWEAYQATTNNIIDVLDKMAQIDKVEHLPVMRQAVSELRILLKTQCDKIETMVKSTEEKPKFLN